MDPALHELLTGDDRAGEVEAIIRLDRPDVDVAGVRIVARFGPVATCRLQAATASWPRWHDDNVLSLKAARRSAPKRRSPTPTSAPATASRATAPAARPAAHRRRRRRRRRRLGLRRRSPELQARRWHDPPARAVGPATRTGARRRPAALRLRGLHGPERRSTLRCALGSRTQRSATTRPTPTATDGRPRHPRAGHRRRQRPGRRPGRRRARGRPRLRPPGRPGHRRARQPRRLGADARGGRLHRPDRRRRGRG